MNISAAILHTLDPYAIDFGGGYGIRWYGLSYLAGFLAGYIIISMMTRRARSPLNYELVSDFVFSVAVGTILGGRLGYCLFYSPELLWDISSQFPFWGALAVHKGGMASHGGMLGIVLACIFFGRRHKLSIPHLFDLTVLGATVGIFFGRIANFINGELYGRPCSTAFNWCVKFPQEILHWLPNETEKLRALSSVAETLAVPPTRWFEWLEVFRFNPNIWGIIDTNLAKIITAVQSGNHTVQEALAPLLTSRHPSQIYEALLEGAFLFIALSIIWIRPKKPGVITGTFFVLYAIVRIIGEEFRMPDANIGFGLFGLTRGQWLSLALLAIGSVLVVVWSKRNVAPLGGWTEGKDR